MLSSLCALLLFLLSCAGAVHQRSWRLEMVAGVRVKFTWRHTLAPNRSAAAAECRSRHSSAMLPFASDLRYFFKTLPLPPARRASVFYLADRLEATLDHPDASVGERLCLVVSKAAAHTVALAEDKAPESCRKSANLVVCRQALPAKRGPTTARPATVHPPRGAAGAPGDEGQTVCLDQDLFYGVLAGGGAILLFLSFVCAALAVQYWRATRQGPGGAPSSLSAPSSQFGAGGGFSRHSSKRSSARAGTTAAMLAADYLSRSQAAAIGASGGLRHVHSLRREQPAASKVQASMLL